MIAVERKKVDSEKYGEDYSDLFWLKLYYKIKLDESQKNVADTLISREMLKVEQIYNFLDFESALDYVNDKIKSQLTWI